MNRKRWVATIYDDFGYVSEITIYSDESMVAGQHITTKKLAYEYMDMYILNKHQWCNIK